MFHFKKFSIDDSMAAMKIGTDAVLLGAWTICKDEIRILDIGTGSGILALMMAQRNKGVPVDAVDLDQDAAKLATENVQLSPWNDQIQIFNTSIQAFSSQAANKYSLVICNPPFFTDSLKGPGKARNMARHNDSMSISDLLESTSKILAKNGKAAFIFPADAFDTWLKEGKRNSLFPSRVTHLKSSATTKPHRIMIEFIFEEIPFIIENELIIYKTQSEFSKEYISLTKDFYLKF